VYLLDHDEAGSIGVVLNRPTGTPVEEIVPRWGLAVSSPGMIFGGGPVSINGAICIARASSAPAPAPPADADSDDPADAGERRPRFQPVVGPIGTVDLHLPPEDLPVSLAEARVFAGYAGWGPGQLESEIEEGSWFVVDAEEGDVFDADPEGLWPRVLRRQGGWLAVIARHPLDPSVN
jgi:putative transcriptional regulator